MPHLHHLASGAGGHQQHLLLPADAAVKQAHKDDDAAVVVVLAVENQRLERGGGIAGRGGDVRHNVLQHGLDVQTRLGGNFRRVLRGQTDDLLDLVLDALGIGGREVDFVDNGQDFQVVVQREVGVRERLRFDALACVHDQHRAFAGREGTADLVVEVHMPRRVDEVEGVALPVGGRIVQTHGAGLDGDAALLLQLHVVEDLILHDALLHRAAFFDQAVGEGGLAVVNVRDDGKIADVLLVNHGLSLPVW